MKKRKSKTEKREMQTVSISFKDVEWGADDAGRDDNLSRYFVEFPGFEKVLNGGKRYIIGRKGTGKTAILQQIRSQLGSDEKSFCVDISLRYFPLNDFKSIGDRGFQNKSKYVTAWKFVLLTEIAQMFVNDNSINDIDGLDALDVFLKNNFPDGVSITNTISTLRKRENKISIATSLLSSDFNSTINTERSAEFHYNRAVKALESIFRTIYSESTYILLFDELDEGYDNDDPRDKPSNLSMVILSLLRATDEIYYLFKDIGVKVLPVLALRSDIYDSLEDNDLNKLDDFVLRLNWTDDFNDPWSLRLIVEKRVSSAIQSRYPNIVVTDYWSLVSAESPNWSVKPDDYAIHEKDYSFQQNWLLSYICRSTFNRPRDVIKFLKLCKEHIKGNKLTFDDVLTVERLYSDWFLRELKDEIHSFLSCWKSALNCIGSLKQGIGFTQDLLEQLDKNEQVKRWCIEHNKTSIDVLRILFEYSVIGCRVSENGRWLFKYIDDQAEFMPGYPYYCVHVGFCRKLGLPRSAKIE